MDCDVVCPCAVGAPATDRKYLGAVTSRSEKDGVAKLTSEDWPSYAQCMHQARGFLTATGESSRVETRSATRGRSDLQRPSIAHGMTYKDVLTLAPECDYRLAEKRLIEVVEDVYSPYRDTVQSVKLYGVFQPLNGTLA